MSNYRPLSQERHASKRWQPAAGYAFAAQDAVVPIVAAELARAMLSLPIAFIEEAGRYITGAVMSLVPDRNLFVTRSGSWSGEYIPSAFRAYPFALANARDGQQVVCIDEDSGQVNDGPEGTPFFAEDGQPAKAILEIMNFLKQTAHSRLATEKACAALQKHNLIQPLQITCKTGAGDRPVLGLFKIDEAALTKLPGEALGELAQTGALMVAYCQLLSMQHLPLLGKLMETHAKTEQSLAANGMPDQSFFKNNETISFAGLI